MLSLPRLAAFGFLLIALPLHAQTRGTLDPSFGENGIVQEDFGLDEPRIEVLSQDKAGNLIIAGTAKSKKIRKVFIARLSASGRLDRSFGENGFAFAGFGGDEAVHGLGLQPDGQIVAAGYFTEGKTEDLALARFNPDGTPSLGFGDSGIVRRDLGGREKLHYLVIDRGGKISVVGFIIRGKDSDFLAGRLNADGSPDLSFGDRGWQVTDSGRQDRLYGAALQADRKLVAAGATGTGKEDCVALRYQTDGRLDAVFGANGVSVLPAGHQQNVCSSVAVGDESAIWLAGYATRPKRDTDFLVIRLSGSGEPDTAFGIQGRLLVDFQGGIDVAHGIAVKGDRVFIGGEFEGSLRRTSKDYYGFALAVLSGGPQKLQRHPVRLRTRNGASATTLLIQQGSEAVLAGYAGSQLGLARFLLRGNDQQRASNPP